MSKLVVNVKESKGQWQGNVSIQGLKSTKIANKDGVVSFANRNVLATVARGLAKRLGMELDLQDASLKAAKKSPKKTAKKKVSKTVSAQSTQTPTA
jgi:hypothetical protein